VGLALAENPLSLGGDDGRPGALGSWLGEALVASAPRLEKLGLGSTGLQDADLKGVFCAVLCLLWCAVLCCAVPCCAMLCCAGGKWCVREVMRLLGR